MLHLGISVDFLYFDLPQNEELQKQVDDLQRELEEKARELDQTE